MGSIRLLANLRQLSSTLYSKRQTKEGLIRIDLSRLTWDSVSGKPSRIHPLTRQSLWRMRWSMRRRRISSGTASPFYAALSIFILMAGDLVASSLSSLAGEMHTRPKAYATRFACVDLPLPGGPIMITFGGLRGAPFLYLILSMVARSFAISYWGLSPASHVYTNWLKVSSTPRWLISYSA